VEKIVFFLRAGGGKKGKVEDQFSRPRRDKKIQVEWAERIGTPIFTDSEVGTNRRRKTGQNPSRSQKGSWQEREGGRGHQFSTSKSGERLLETRGGKQGGLNTPRPKPHFFPHLKKKLGGEKTKKKPRKHLRVQKACRLLQKGGKGEQEVWGEKFRGGVEVCGRNRKNEHRGPVGYSRENRESRGKCKMGGGKRDKNQGIQSEGTTIPKPNLRSKNVGHKKEHQRERANKSKGGRYPT